MTSRKRINTKNDIQNTGYSFGKSWSDSERFSNGIRFWDPKGILFVDYLQIGKTLNSEYYCNLLDQSKEKIVKKDTVCRRKNPFHKDNAPCHKIIITMTMAKIHECKFELLKHPPCSPASAPATSICLQNSQKYALQPFLIK